MKWNSEFARALLATAAATGFLLLGAAGQAQAAPRQADAQQVNAQQPASQKPSDQQAQARDGQSDAARKAMQEAEAAPTPRLPDGHPDLSGRWGGAGGSIVFTTKDGEVHSLLPAREAANDPNKVQAQYNVLFDGDARRAGNKNKPPYKPELAAKVADLDLNESVKDPLTICHPAGIPRAGAPARIVASPGAVVFLYSGEDGDPWRIIPTDGRAHRDDLDPSYFGDSVGHWEGDTLVVDVNGFNDDTWFGTDGWFHSDQLHVVERLTRKGNTLRYEVTVDDPVVLTRPWVFDPRIVRLDTKPTDEIYEMAPCTVIDKSHYVNHDHF